MTKSYAYRVRLDDIRDRLGHALRAYKFAPEQAIGYTIVECALLDGDSISEALSFVALAKVASEFNDSAQTEVISAYLRQHCSESHTAAAALALQSEDDRQAFLHDLTEVRAG